MRPRISCPNCGSEVDHLAFCGVCGQDLPAMDDASESAPSSRLAWLRNLRRIPSYRVVLLVGLLIVLAALLADEAGLAIAVSVVIVPMLAVSYLTGIDIYEREPWTIILGVVGAGAIVGLIAGWLSSLAFDQLWFDTSPFNLGAAGYAGAAADGQGDAPISVMLISGVLIPVLAAVATLAGPVSLRRSSTFRNEVMDGVTLGAAAGGGFAITTAIVYFWPVFFDSVPSRSVSEWSAALTGIVIFRPLIFAFAGALLGAAVWSYVLTQRSRDLAWPLAAGILGWLGTSIGTLLLIPYGTGWELLWSAVVLLAVFVLFREAVRSGLALDRRILVGDGSAQRVVCPNCGRVTPNGEYCAFCGADLHEGERPAISERVSASSTTTTSAVIEPQEARPMEREAVSDGESSRDSIAVEPVEELVPRRAPIGIPDDSDDEDDDLSYLNVAIDDEPTPAESAVQESDFLAAAPIDTETVEPESPRPLTPPVSWYDMGRDELPETDVARDANLREEENVAADPSEQDRRPEAEQADAWATLDADQGGSFDETAEDPTFSAQSEAAASDDSANEAGSPRDTENRPIRENGGRR